LKSVLEGKRREELCLIGLKVVVKGEREEMRVLNAHDEGVSMQ